MERASDQAVPTSITGATWLGFGAMCVGMFMAIHDVQIVATSLPTIQEALKIDPAQMSWVQTAYLVAEVISIPMTGFLMRMLSTRWLFVTSVAMFTAASIGCAASSQFPTLIGWRIVQGFFGGTLILAVFAAVFLLFPARRQALATTLAGIMAVFAPTVGPISGGWIAATFSWHWLFIVNVPRGIVCLGLALSPAAEALPNVWCAEASERSPFVVALSVMTVLAPQVGRLQSHP